MVVAVVPHQEADVDNEFKFTHIYMKKYFSFIIPLILSSSAFAQTQSAYDFLAASASDISGTARFMGVGGAMGALGGDASTIFYNPAGIGIYRSSEFTVSANINWNNTSMINSNSRYDGYKDRTDIDLQHVAYVGTWVFEENKNLLNFNLGIAYNQNKKFRREGTYKGTQPHSYTQWIAAMTDGINVEELSSDYTWNNMPEYIPWGSVLAFNSHLIGSEIRSNDHYSSLYDMAERNPVSQNLKFEEFGSGNDFALSFAGNFNNLIYWGMTFECDYTNYGKSITLQESFTDGSVYSLHNRYNLKAVGFTYKLGLILKPVSWLRIGAAFHTPTAYSIKDSYYSTCAYDVYDVNWKRQYGTNDTPKVIGDTKFTGPLKAIGSLGFVIGKFGFIGIDYQYENTAGINDIEKQVKDRYAGYLKDRHIIRAGIEVKPIEELSLRLGAGYSTPRTSNEMNREYYFNDMRIDTDYYNEKQSYNVNAGIGYRIGRHAIDLAYVWQVNTADYYPYSPSFTKYDGSLFQLQNYKPIGLRSVLNQIVLTYGVRF